MVERYKATESIDPSQPIPKKYLAKHSSDSMLIFTAFLGVLIACIIIFIGYKGRVIWMKVWGIGLILFSLFLGVSMHFNWQLTALRNWILL